VIHLIALALALTPTQQTKHDDIERAAFDRLQAQTQSIFEQDHPSKRTVDDYKKARACYTSLHLYRVQSCDAALSKVDSDLAATPKEQQ
jgi:hypothetical protein